jgi:RimJ/RimL family protein N-acetyltransferase
MDARAELTAVWPLFGLEVRTPRLVLRLPDESDLATLGDLSDDVHAPDAMPFLQPWTRAPRHERRRNLLQHRWGQLAAWSPDRWELGLAVVVDHEVVGVQDVVATGFALRRTVSTGSWLHRPRQGHGLGTEMRAAVLDLAFAGLGAQRAESGSLDGNPASAAVSRRLGYGPNGTAIHAIEGQRRVEQRFVLERAEWEARRRGDITLAGIDACRPLFGL